MQQVCEKVQFKPLVTFFPDHNGLNVEVETARLLIRSYNEIDFENCVALYGDELNIKLFDYGSVLSKKEISQLIQQKGRTYFSKREPFGLFSIFLKENMDFIGQIDLIPTNEFGSVEIGFILHRKYQNQGLCSEAVKAFIETLIEEINYKENFSKYSPIDKIIATVHPKNLPSKRVLEKNGMYLEKTQNRFGGPRLCYACPTKQTINNLGAK